jgi:hypothetical protein
MKILILFSNIKTIISLFLTGAIFGLSCSTLFCHVLLCSVFTVLQIKRTQYNFQLLKSWIQLFRVMLTSVSELFNMLGHEQSFIRLNQCIELWTMTKVTLTLCFHLNSQDSLWIISLIRRSTSILLTNVRLNSHLI